MKLTLYNLDKLIREKSNNEEKAYYSNQECAIIEGTFGFVLAYFNCNYITCESADDMIELELLAADSDDDQFFAHGNIELTIREIIKNAPATEIDSHDFFHRKDYNFHEQKKFIELKQVLNTIGVSINTDI
jgi:hypothetical protein